MEDFGKAKEQTYDFINYVLSPAGQKIALVGDERAPEVYGFTWKEGSDELLGSLGDDGALLPDNVADDKEAAAEAFLKEYTTSVEPTMNYDSKATIKNKKIW